MAYQITTKHIIEKEQDLAGKWRVLVKMPDGNLQMLKFQKDPIITEIQPEIDKIIKSKETNKQTEIEMINQQIASLEERKNN